MELQVKPPRAHCAWTRACKETSQRRGVDRELALRQGWLSAEFEPRPFWLLELLVGHLEDRFEALEQGL